MSKAHGGSKRQVRSPARRKAAWTRLLRDREEWARRAPGHPGNPCLCTRNRPCKVGCMPCVENCPGIMRHGREVL